MSSNVVKEVKYTNPNRNNHHCKTLVIRCMDFRFHELLARHIDELFLDLGGLGEYDSPGPCGGGSLSLINPEMRQRTFDAINIAVERHGIEQIVVVDHIDCGAWGGSVRFHNHSETERAFHVDKLRESAKILESEYPNLLVHLVYQDWDRIQRISA